LGKRASRKWRKEPLIRKCLTKKVPSKLGGGRRGVRSAKGKDTLSLDRKLGICASILLGVAADVIGSGARGEKAEENRFEKRGRKEGHLPPVEGKKRTLSGRGVKEHHANPALCRKRRRESMCISLRLGGEKRYSRQGSGIENTFRPRKKGGQEGRPDGRKTLANQKERIEVTNEVSREKPMRKKTHESV